jgi:Aerotolerance regulator N-terminal
MVFLNIYLLGGLALLGVPVVLHFWMRQKPRRLPFPAFRFLRQRSVVNRRRMRLQHLLLLALRMLVLAALCFAIAQPKLFLPRAMAKWFGLSSPRPVAAVFVFDVSYRMEYRVGGLSRLDDARQRALDLLHNLPLESQVAVLDTGADGADDEADEDWIPSPAQVRSRINGLRLRPIRAPLVRQIEKAADLLAKAGQAGEPASRMLYVFSDRATAGWDGAEAKRIKIPDGVQAAYIDLGVDQPRDLGVEKIEVSPLVVAPGGTVTVTVDIRAVGADFDVNLLCQIDNDANPASRHVKMTAGKDREVFVLKAPTPVRPAGAGDEVITEPHQITVKFSTLEDRAFKDDLAHDNVRFATFQVRDDPKRQGRRILTLADDPKAAHIWKAALDAYGITNPTNGFRCDVRLASEAVNFGLKELRPYRAVCLFQTAKRLPEPFWQALAKYVRDGGGLVIVPPGEELSGAQIEAWNKDAETAKLLPARLKTIADPPADRPVYWNEFDANHPLTRPFHQWLRQGVDFATEALRPFVNRYWEVEPIENGRAIAAYADEAKSPALVERALGEGRVIQFTTVLDAREIGPNRQWTNFWTLQSFGLVLVNEACKYVAGEAPAEQLNFRCGDPVVLNLPAAAPRGVYHLDAPDPDLTESERSITVAEGDKTVDVRAASAPGQYALFDPGRNRVAAFSLNLSPEESRLDRLPAKDVEAVLGAGSVLAPQPGASLNDALREHGQDATESQSPAAPVSLLPLLMMLTLLFLTVEGRLANRFYERISR